MKFAVLLFLALIVAGCASEPLSRQTSAPLALPPMNTFSQRTPVLTPTSNATILTDFVDLTFTLENGAKMKHFTRFEGPVAVRVLGAMPPSLGPDLDALLERLRREARIDISRVPASTPAEITVHLVTKSQIQSVAPSAACFVRPNVSSWADYLSRRDDPSTFWDRLESREEMAVFLPSDVSPQEIRDCLHEEIAQALGPVNDLYRLPQSIFNDDNFHTVLTAFDMLILRATYSDALRNGMSQREVTRILPDVLWPLNPRGGVAVAPGGALENSEWTRAITIAANPDQPGQRRQSEARRAVNLARVFGINDVRLAYSHYILARVSLSDDPGTALSSFLAAGKIYQRRPDTALQEAHIAVQVAALQLSGGRASTALSFVDRSLSVVEQAENAALLSLLLLLKSEALSSLGRTDEAQSTQERALAWARYGFGDPNEIFARVEEIRAISPRNLQEAPS